MKVLKMLVVAALASAILTGVSLAAEKTCCEKAAAEGKECTHKCCVEAKKAGKVCEKCNPAKKDEKKEEKKDK